MTYVIVKALIPIFVIMGLGFYAGKAKIVDNKHIDLLNIFVMDFALLAALFNATVKTSWQGTIQQSPLVVILVLSMWSIFGAIYLISIKLFHKFAQDVAILTLTVALSNYAALALPILNNVIGEGAIVSLFVAISIACGFIFLTPFCLFILEKEKACLPGALHGSIFKILPILIWRTMMKPIVYGPLLGIILSGLGN